MQGYIYMNKYKTLALNTVVFAIGNFGSKLLSFFLNYLYTGHMSSGVFNTKEILELCANFLIPVVSFSITDAVIRYGLDKNYDNRAVFSNAVTLLLCGLGGFLLLSPLLRLYGDIRPYWLLLVGYICVSCFRQLSTQFARARGFVKLYAADGIFCTLLLFLFNLIFIAKLEWGVTGFLLSVMLSDLCSGVMVWFIARHGRYFSFRYLDKELLRVMLRFSLPLIPTAIMWLITGFSDRLFIRHMLSDTAAGVYGAAAKLPNLISMVSTIFFQAWNMSAISENDSAGRSKFYSQVYDAYISILFVAGAGIIAFVKPLSALIINTDKDAAYESAYLFTPMLVVAVLLMCFNQFLSSIYTVSRHTQNSFWTSLVAAVLNLLLNALLIPKFGVHGAIAATFVSYFICYLIRIVDTQQYISFRIAHGRFLINLLILFAMCEVILHVKAMTALWLGLGLVIITLLNLRAILLTARKVLRRN